jgi:hypothetical protein
VYTGPEKTGYTVTETGCKHTHTCHIALRVIPTPRNLKPPACNGLDVIGKQLKQLTAPITSSIKLAASGVVAGGAPPATCGIKHRHSTDCECRYALRSCINSSYHEHLYVLQKLIAAATTERSVIDCILMLIQHCFFETIASRTALSIALAATSARACCKMQGHRIYRH